jgi:hypothetical protein
VRSFFHFHGDMGHASCDPLTNGTFREEMQALRNASREDLYVGALTMIGIFALVYYVGYYRRTVEERKQ